MWVPREGTCFRIPAGMAPREGTKAPGISPCPFGVTANGSPARSPPSQWARGPGIHQRCSRGATEPWGSELQLGIHGGALGLGAGNMQVRGL